MIRKTLLPALLLGLSAARLVFAPAQAAQQVINLTPGSGDSLPVGGAKINANFVELYSLIGDGGVTQVQCGAGLDGGTITTTGVCSVKYGTTAGTAAEGNDPRLANDRTASGLRTTSGIVVVNGSIAPSPGQVLTATGPGSANWATPPAGGGTGGTGGGVAGVAAGDSTILIGGSGTNPTVRVNVGTTAGTVAAADDSRFSDARTPTDGSVTDAKVASGAAIAESKLNLATDAAANVGSRRTLGLLATQAAPGNTSVQKGPATASGLTVSGPGKILGRFTAGAGAQEEYSIGTGFTVSGGSTLNAVAVPAAVFSSASNDCSADVSTALKAHMTANGGAAIMRAGCYRLDSSLIKSVGAGAFTLTAYGDGPVQIYQALPATSAVKIDNTDLASASIDVTAPVATVTPSGSDDRIDQLTLASLPSTFVRGAQCAIVSDDMSIGQGTLAITAISNASPAVITVPGNPSKFANGDTVRIQYATGLTALNSTSATYTLGSKTSISGGTATTFTLVGTDTTSAGTYTGGGYIGGVSGSSNLDAHGLSGEGFTIHSTEAGNKVNIYGRLKYGHRYLNNAQVYCLDSTFKVRIEGITFTSRGNDTAATSTRAPFIDQAGTVGSIIRNNIFERPYNAAIRTVASAGGQFTGNLSRYGINNPSLQQYTYGIYFYSVNWNHVIDGYVQEQGRHAVTTDGLSNASLSAPRTSRGVPHDITIYNLACKTVDGTCADEHPEGFNLVFKGVDCTKPQKGSVTVSGTITGSCMQSRGLNPIYENVTVAGGTRGIAITQIDHGLPNTITVDGFTVRDLTSSFSSSEGGRWADAAISADAQDLSNVRTRIVLKNMTVEGVGVALDIRENNQVIVDGLMTRNVDDIARVRAGARIDFFGSQVWDWRHKALDGTSLFPNSRIGTSSTNFNSGCYMYGSTAYGPSACYFHTQPKIFKEAEFAPRALLVANDSTGGAKVYYMANGIEEIKPAGVVATLQNVGTIVAATDVSVAYASGSGGGVTDGDKGDVTVSGGGTAWTLKTVTSNKGGAGPKRNRIAFIGDSITAAGKNPGSTTQLYRNARGYMTWLNFYCGQCFETDTSLNYGVGGYSTTDVINQLPAIVTAAPDVATVLIGTNDLPGSTRTVALITADLNTIYQTLGAAGIKVVAIPILPRAGSAGSDWTGLTTAETTVARNKLNGVNNYIRNYNLTNPPYKIIVAETYKYDVDYASATGDPLPGRRVDGLHPNVTGHERIGYGLFEAMQSILPSFSYRQWLTPSDVFDATNNPRGNLLTNGFLAGTGGGVGSGTSGSVAASWGLSRSGSNITGVASKQTLGADGSTAGAQRIVASTTGTSGTGTLETITLTQTISSNIVAGDTVVVSCSLSGSTLSGNNLVSSQLRLSNAGGTSQNSYGLAGNGLTDLMPTIPYAGVVSTDPLTMPTGVTSVSVRFEIEMDATKTGSVQMDLSRCSLRKII